MKKYIDEALLKEIALRIKVLRKEKDLSQIEFLIATDINISRIEIAKNNSLSDFLKDIPKSKFPKE